MPRNANLSRNQFARLQIRQKMLPQSLPSHAKVYQSKALGFAADAF